MDIGTQIKRARARCGVSQRRLARMTGLTQAAISYIESGTNTPTVGTLESISKALGVELVVIEQSNLSIRGCEGNTVEDVLQRVISKYGLCVKTDAGTFNIPPQKDVDVKFYKSALTINL